MEVTRFQLSLGSMSQQTVEGIKKKKKWNMIPAELRQTQGQKKKGSR